jgi:curved DNA-binding protein
VADDLYQTLGVSRSADPKEIHRAYRELARKYHPDVNKDPGAEDQFKRISEAHEVLSDPETRAQYDRFGPNFRQYAAAGAGAGGAGRQPPRSAARSGGSPRYSTWSSASGAASADGGIDWDDIFGDVFGASRGMDHSAELELSVEEAYRGGRRTIQLEDPSTGEVSTYEVEIPPGALDGQRIRIPGAGAGGRRDGGRGDLVITLRVRPSKRYRLNGADIEMDLSVSPWEAALGAEVKTNAPGGPVTLHVPPGSSCGRRLRLRGQGMPQPGGRNGDLYARVKIAVPSKLTDRERSLFEQLSRESSFDPRRS